MKESLNILLLSSRMPSYSANLGKDVITSLTRAGHNVQFGFDGVEKYIKKQTTPKENTFIKRGFIKFHFYLRKYLKVISDFITCPDPWVKDGTVFFHPYENKPPISDKIVVDNLHGNFDLCFVLFTHNMFTAKTYKAIYDKFHCPIILSGIDMMSMTGGCYYFGECRNFEKECGYCPVCGKKYRNDQSHKNYLYKKYVYDSIECVFFGTSWQLSFAKRSHLFDNSRMRCVNLNLDENIYKPLDTVVCREKFGINPNKRWIFLSRYRNIARKGMDILVDGINGLYESLTPEKREQALLVLIGEKSDGVKDLFSMDVIQLGFLNTSSLIEAYNASTAFLCTSTEDAGPSMINQSMACGTPVIAFDAGCSPDMIDDGINGFKTSLAEKWKWGEGLKRLCALSCEEYAEMRIQARKKAVEMNGLHVLANAVEEVYQEFRPNGKK